MNPAEGWPAYLARFHAERPGITEATLGTARDATGADPYAWAVAPLAPVGTLLDVACGNAALAARAGGRRWIGVDLAAAELAAAGRVGPVVRADATALPVRTGRVDSAVCAMAAMSIQPLAGLLAELRRVLSDDGTVVVVVPGGRPLGAGDLVRWAALVAAARRAHLAYANDAALRRPGRVAAAAGLRVVDDVRRRFVLPLPDVAATQRLVASLYLPGITESGLRTTRSVAARWAGGAIGIPLRRITLRPMH